MKPALIDVSVLINFFTRPTHLINLFTELQKVRPQQLFLYQDGPRNEKDLEAIMECRKIVEKMIDWECNIHRKYQEKNYGVDPSGFIAQKWAYSIADKVIVMEDDDVPSLSMFQYFKELLDRYENDERIGMITAVNPEEVTCDMPYDYFFTSNFFHWGWASWRRVIDTWDEHYNFMDDTFNFHQLKLLVKEKGLHNGFLGMLPKHRKSGKAFYESIFYASMLMHSQLCIVPTKNLINNNSLNTEASHFEGQDLRTMPKGSKKVFTMKRYEIEFPLKHPKYVMEYVPHRQNVYKIMAWKHPWIKIGRSFEELFLNLRYGNFKYIGKSIRNRIQKTFHV